MNIQSIAVLALFASVPATTACSSSEATSPTDSGTLHDETPHLCTLHSRPAMAATPTVYIESCACCTSTFALDINVAIANFELKPANTCGAAASCGHAFVTFDGANCNDGEKPYNVAIVSGTASGTLLTAHALVDVSKCKTPVIGKSVELVVELRKDNDDALTPPIVDKSTVIIPAK